MNELKRIRLPLERHGSELLLVGDRFEEGGRYVSLEVPLGESESWNWLDWDNRYDALAEEWHRRYDAEADPTACPPDCHLQDVRHAHGVRLYEPKPS